MPCTQGALEPAAPGPRGAGRGATGRDAHGGLADSTTAVRRGSYSSLHRTPLRAGTLRRRQAGSPTRPCAGAEASGPWQPRAVRGRRRKVPGEGPGRNCAFWPVPPPARHTQPNVAGLPARWWSVSTTGEPATPYKAGWRWPRRLNARLILRAGQPARRQPDRQTTVWTTPSQVFTALQVTAGRASLHARPQLTGVRSASALGHDR